MTEPFPAIVSTLSPAALIEQVLPGFGIGPVDECIFFSGGFNHTYRVRTRSAETYYLRAYRPRWRSLADIQCELEALDYLAGRDFPAGKPLTYKDGKLYCSISAAEGTRHLALFSEAPGPEINYKHEPEQTARVYGRAVANMHYALEGFSSGHLRFHLDLHHLVEEPLMHVEPFLSRREQDWAYLRAFGARLHEGISALADDLEQGFCHGDLQGYHANVSPDGTLTFFDFDCGGFGFRAYDLAVFLWCCRLEDGPERWQPFLDGYLETRPMSELDLQAVSLFTCARFLWHMGVHSQNAPDWGSEFLNDEYFDTHMERVRRAEADLLD